MNDDLGPDERRLVERIRALSDTPLSTARAASEVAARATAGQSADRWRGLIGIGLLAAAVVVGLAVRAHMVVPVTQPSDSIRPTDVPTTEPAQPQPGVFHGDGWTFDYPSTWKPYPMRVVAFEFTTVGYVASTTIDTSAICSETEDSASCDFGAYRLPPGNVVIGLANWAPGIEDPVRFFEHPRVGHTVVVGGMPAVMTEDQIADNRVRLEWKIARPDVFGVWVQFTADVRGPRLGELRDAVEASIRSFRFLPPPVPLPQSDEAADAVARQAIASLQAEDADAYACLPQMVGVDKTETVEAIPAGDLKKPLQVTCSVTISRTDVGFWKMTLRIEWDSGVETVVQWLFPDGTLSARSDRGAPPTDYCCR
jgi:hypothetical protein